MKGNMKKTPTIVCCETCKYWRRGDLSAQRIGNVGQCSWMMNRSSVTYAPVTHVPFWAHKVTVQTIGFEGKNCEVYEPASKKQIIENSKL